MTDWITPVATLVGVLVGSGTTIGVEVFRGNRESAARGRQVLAEQCSKFIDYARETLKVVAMRDAYKAFALPGLTGRQLELIEQVTHAQALVEQSLAQMKLLGPRELANAALIMADEIRRKSLGESTAKHKGIGFEKAEEIFILVARSHLKLKMEMPPSWTSQAQSSNAGETLPAPSAVAAPEAE